MSCRCHRGTRRGGNLEGRCDRVKPQQGIPRELGENPPAIEKSILLDCYLMLDA